METGNAMRKPFRPLSINSRQVALLNALAECRSLRRAAAAMHTTQPAATALLQQLEKALDVKLFERHSRGMQPTPYGEVMIRYARGVLHDLERAEDEIMALGRGAAGLVRIGSVMGVTPTLLSRSLSAFKTANPRVQIALHVDTSDILIPALVRGDFDLVLGRLPDQFSSRDLSVEPFAQGEPMVVVARPGHPVFDLPTVELADLVGLTWILHPPGSPMRRRVEAALQQANMHTALDIVETTSILATTSLMVATDMISIVSLDVAEHYAAYGMISIVSVELPIAMANLGVITRGAEHLAPATQAFLEYLHACNQVVTRADHMTRESAGRE